MSDFPFLTADSPEYVAAFQTLVQAYPADLNREAVLEEAVRGYDRKAVAVDWGAGPGGLTRWLLARFDTVYAVEPGEAMRAVLARNCPTARIVAGSIQDAAVPEAIDVGVIRHVFYHVPDHKWGAYTLRAANRLSARGVLAVILKRPDTACNAMLEAFGAPRLDLFRLDETFHRHPEFRVEQVTQAEPLVTTRFEDTLAIACFMLSDRPPDAYARSFGLEEVRAYVRRHLWDESAGRGGWRCDTLTYLIRRNPFWKR